MIMNDDTDTLGAQVKLIRLVDGTLIDPLTRLPMNTTQKPSESPSGATTGDDSESDDDDVEDQLQIVPLHRRSVMDMNLSPQQMAMVNNVLVYTLWGLPDDEVALQCNCTIHQVQVVRALDDYSKMKDGLIEGLKAAYSNSVQGIIAEAAPRAARGMIRNLRSKSPDIQQSAMKDILDRAGHRPADRVEHTHNIGSGSELVIRVIKQTESDALPVLDLEAIR